MDLQEYADRLRAFRDELIANREEETKKIVLDSIALLKRRIVNKGQKADGSQFGDYSEAVVPYWFYKGKDTNRSNSAAVGDLLEKHGYFASYKDWREINNLPTDKINLSFTNEMLNSLVPVVISSDRDKIIIEIQSRTKKGRDKVRWLSDRYGNILLLSKDEQEIINEAYQKRYLKIYRKYLG